MPEILIPLEDTIVVCMGAGKRQDQPPRVVQITCRAERPELVETITTFYLVQHELSELILRVVGAQMEDHVPSPLTFEGERYTLQAIYAPWSFGKKVAFLWGDEPLEASEYKWTFVFKAKRRERLPTPASAPNV